MEFLSEKKNLLMFCLTIFIIGGISYVVFGTIKEKAEKVSLLDQQFQFQDERGQYLSVAQREIEEAKGDITLAENSIIAAESHIAFIESIESLARQNNLSIEIESLGFEENPLLKASNISAFKIKAKTKGAWAGTYRFMVALESLPEKIQINKFSLALSSGRDDESGTWQSNFEITALKYK